MVSLRPASLAALVLPFLVGCPNPDSVEMGGLCKDPVECKAPADTCLLQTGAKQRCSMKCDKENRCPSKDFVCAKMDITVAKDGTTEHTGRYGYCLPKAEVPPNAATLY